jgi:hypothetical protein
MGRSGNWFLSCRNGHQKIFAITAMLKAGAVTCAECVRDAATQAARQKQAKEVDELIAAGREYEPNFLKENS